jgi:UDP-glucose 6-dehydrogenase
MHIAMLATSHVGLISGACFANSGHQATCVGDAEDEINGPELSP